MPVLCSLPSHHKRCRVYQSELLFLGSFKIHSGIGLWEGKRILNVHGTTVVGSSLQKGANSHPIWHRWLDTVLRTSFSPHLGSNREVEQRCLHERISRIRLGSRYPRFGRATRRVLTRAGFYCHASGQGFNTSRQRCKLLERQSLGMCVHKVMGAQCLQWCFPVASFTCFVISFFF